jgi:hypothetical protein
MVNIAVVMHTESGLFRKKWVRSRSRYITRGCWILRLDSQST